MYLNLMLIVLIVTYNLVLIKFHESLHFPEVVSICFLAASVTTALGVNYIKLGEINETSKKLTQAWKRNPEILGAAGSFQKKVASRFVRSLQILRIELGPFGYYRKPASIRIIGKLVFYTARGLLVTKNRF
jgi:hypothetical protein